MTRLSEAAEILRQRGLDVAVDELHHYLIAKDNRPQSEAGHHSPGTHTHDTPTPTPRPRRSKRSAR